MIDTHCHLTDPRLFSQLEAVLARAATAGVHRLITIGTNLDDDQAVLAVCENRPNLRCAIGIHPNYVTPEARDRVSLLRGLLHHPAVVALGEMGLDYHYDDVPRDLQRDIFQAQLVIAQEAGLPVVIHSRESADDTLAILADFPAIPAVFHCFTGTAEEARRIADRGYCIGFTGPVTFKKNDELRAIAAAVPDDQILVETDAPYLSPEPLRKQKTCEPAFVIHTAAVIAQQRNMTIEAFDALTTANAARLFRWP